MTKKPRSPEAIAIERVKIAVAKIEAAMVAGPGKLGAHAAELSMATRDFVKVVIGEYRETPNKGVIP